MDYINTLISGIVVFKVGKTYVHTKPASAEDKTFADFFAQEQYDDSLLDGIWTQEEAEDHLMSMGYLPKDHEKQMEDIKEKMDTMRVDYFNHFYDSMTREYIKKNLEKQQAKYDDLNMKKYVFYDKTCDYLKKYSSLSYLLQKNSFLKDQDLACLYYSIQSLYNKYIGVTNEIGTHIREIAKSVEWKNRWFSTKIETFDNSKSSFTDLQLALISWATYYDGIYQSMDKPSDEVMEDDIALDGWSILEKRKRKKEEKQRNAEKMLPGNMKNAGEVFIPARNQQQASDIMSLNNMSAQGKIKSLQSDLKTYGSVNESDLTSTRQEIQMEAIRLQKENRRR